MRRTCEACGHSYNDEYNYTLCPHVPLGAGPDPFHPTRNPGGYCKEHDFFACKVPVHRGDREMSEFKATSTHELREAARAYLANVFNPGGPPGDPHVVQAATYVLTCSFQEEPDVRPPIPLKEDDLFAQAGPPAAINEGGDTYAGGANWMPTVGKDPRFLRSGMAGIVEGGEQGYRRPKTPGIPPAQDGPLSFLQFATWESGDYFLDQVRLAAHEIASYHKPTEDQTQRHLLLTLALEQYLVSVIQACPPGPERSTAISWARASKMFAAAAISLEK